MMKHDIHSGGKVTCREKGRKSDMKKILAMGFILTMMIGLAACGAAGSAKEAATSDNAAESASSDITGSAAETESAGSEEKADAAETAGVHHAEIAIKDYGTIKLELDGDAAPITVENFITLAKDGFYDGLTFHRIMDGFMIQGGDPEGNGTGGSDTTIKGEFAENGVDNPISHKAGVISMARAQDPDSASSQFFITVADSEFLDGQYAAFGHVTEGMEVAEQIAKDAKPTDGNGTIPPEDQPVIESIKILD